MTSQEFVDLIRLNVHEGGTTGYLSSLRKPAGRSPRQLLVQQSKLYNSLTPDQQQTFDTIVRDAVAAGVFGFLCVLDGVAMTKESASGGRFELNHVHDGKTTLLNDNERAFLHDLFKATWDEHEVLGIDYGPGIKSVRGHRRPGESI